MIRQRPQRILGPTDSRASRRPAHGLSRVEIAMILAAQGGACLYCGKHDPGPRGWVVDHDHALAATHPHPVTRGCRRCVRGVADDDCNVGLGRFKDNPDVLRRAADVIEAFRARNAAASAGIRGRP